MKNIKLDAILLLALVIPFIMTYRLSPGNTPYWLFSFIFLSLLAYIILDILTIGKNVYFMLKQIMLWVLIVGVIGSSFTAAIIVRHKTHPIYQIHDMPLQQEIAIRFLLDGKNPYSTTYFGTFLEQWNYSDKDKNPALYHFVLPPFYILFASPFYFFGNHVFGYFDARMPLLFLFFTILCVTSLIIKDKEKKLLALILITFNPAMLGYTLEGRSDIFMFAFLFLGLYSLYKQKFSLAGIPIALAFAVKQSAWPFLPFYFVFIYFKTRSLLKTIKLLLPFFITFCTIFIPFLLWDKKAFIESTILYLSGSGEHNYPVAGYGVGMLLKEFGFIKDVQAYYPFIILQTIVCVPLLIFLLKFLHGKSTVSRLILVYGIFLFVFWYFSRYFNNSHLGYLSLVFITAYFFPQEDQKEV